MSHKRKRGTNDVGKSEVAEVRVYVLHVSGSQSTHSVNVTKIS